MSSISTHNQLVINKPFNENELLKGVYMVVINATRIPPHIGLIIEGKYHSLNIKGQDINTPVAALAKNSMQRKIPSLFIKIKPHYTFSDTYLKEHFITNVQQFKRVDVGIATCLSPVKLFFEEVYNVPMDKINYLFELIPVLYKEQLIEAVSSLFINEQDYTLPIYTMNEINTGIADARLVGVNSIQQKQSV